MAQEENQIQVILTELLAEDRQLLGKKDELIERLSEKVGAEDQRDYKSLRIALKENDLGELMLLADNGTPEEKEAAEAEAMERLSHMQESRARLVMEILVGAMGWHKEPEAEAEAEDHAELQEMAGGEQAVQEKPQVQQAEEKQEETWECVCGRKNNKKKFCLECGRARTEGEVKGAKGAAENWTCSQCGHVGNKANFCVACGSPREEGVTAKSAVPSVKSADQMDAPELEQTNMATETTEAALTKDDAQLSKTAAQADMGQTQVIPASVIPQVRDDMPQVSAQVVEQRVLSNPSVPPSVRHPVMQPQTAQPSTGRNGTQTAIIGVIVLLVCVLGFMGFKEISAGSDTKSSSGYHSLAKTADNANSDEKSQPVAKTELSLGGMDLDEEVAVMFDKLGKEKSCENGDNGYAFYKYDGMKVGVKNGVVKALVSDGANCKTKRGIHEGSTLQEVLDAYGSDAMKTNYDGLVLYEYDFKSLTGEDGILRFAINGQNKVDYISVRIPEEPKLDTQALGNAAKNAVGLYHQNITQRNYRAAYDLLTSSMQNTMGAYENWVKGFSNTIESRVTEIQVTNVQADRVDVSFILLARDKRPGGGVEENRFRSTATVVQEGGSWKIASVKNKKI